MTSNEVSTDKIRTINQRQYANYKSQFNDQCIPVSNRGKNTSNNKDSITKKFASIFKNSKNNNDQMVMSNSNKNELYDSNRSNLKLQIKAPPADNKERLQTKESTLNNSDTEIINRFQLHQIVKDLIIIINKETPTHHVQNGRSNKFSPGIVGIVNHGNTCYMNVIIQCLAHLDGVTEYFTSHDYLTEIIGTKSSNNSINNAPSNPNYLDLTLGFSLLLESLWNCTYTSVISSKFRELISYFYEKYSLPIQQDAHEFLLNLIDLLQSLFTDNIQQKLFIESKFQISISNELTCYQCKKTKKLPSTEMCLLDLPIPNKYVALNQMVYFILVNNSFQIYEKHAIKIDTLSTVGNVRTILASRLNCDSSDVLIVEVKETGFGRILLSKENMYNMCQQLQSSDNCTYDSRGNGLYAIYIHSLVIDVDAIHLGNTQSSNQINGDSVDSKEETYLNYPFIRLLIVHIRKLDDFQSQFTTDDMTLNSRKRCDDRATSKNLYQRFSRVLTIQASRKTRLDLLRRSLTEQMCKSLNIKNIAKLPTPRIVIEDSYLLKESDVYPFTNPKINDYLRLNGELCKNEDDGNLPNGSFITINVVWPFDILQQLRLNKIAALQDTKMSINQLNKTKIIEHESVKLLTEELEEMYRENSGPTSLSDCLNKYFSSDIESWNCPHCKRSNDAKSKLRATNAPDILVLSLKRFHGSSNSSPDLSALVKNQQNSTVPRFSNPKNLPSFNKKPLISRTLSHNCPVQSCNNNHIICDRNVQHQYSSPVRSKSRNNIFKNSIDSFDKLESFVEYPLEDFDLKPYIEDPKDDDDEYKYDLMGVVNHSGTMTNGHYTAICRYSLDEKWWLFDDENVSQIHNVNNVINRDAYILFYQKRSSRFSGNFSGNKNTENLTTPSSQFSNLHLCLRRRMTFPNFPDKTVPYLDPIPSHSSSTNTITSAISVQRPYSLINHIPSPQINLSNPILAESSLTSSVLSLPTSPINLDADGDTVTAYDSGTVVSSNDSWLETVPTNQIDKNLSKSNHHNTCSSIRTKASDECYISASSPVSLNDYEANIVEKA